MLSTLGGLIPFHSANIVKNIDNNNLCYFDWREELSTSRQKSANNLPNQSRGVKLYRKLIYPQLSEHFRWKELIHIAFITEVAYRLPERPWGHRPLNLKDLGGDPFVLMAGTRRIHSQRQSAVLTDCLPVWHESVLLPPEHGAHIGSVISWGVKVSVVTCGVHEGREIGWNTDI